MPQTGEQSRKDDYPSGKHDIKVSEGEKGLFIAMPSKKALDGEYRDIAHPINSGTRERIQSTILARYQQALEEEPEPLVVDEM